MKLFNFRSPPCSSAPNNPVPTNNACLTLSVTTVFTPTTNSSNQSITTSGGSRQVTLVTPSHDYSNDKGR